jgi:hypothetical protein
MSVFMDYPFFRGFSGHINKSQSILNKNKESNGKKTHGSGCRLGVLGMWWSGSSAPHKTEHGKKRHECHTSLPRASHRQFIPSTPSLQPEPCVFLPLFCLFLFSS